MKFSDVRGRVMTVVPRSLSVLEDTRDTFDGYENVQVLPSTLSSLYSKERYIPICQFVYC